MKFPSRLWALRTFRFTGHPVLSIDPDRLERLDSILQFQLDKILA